jgi:hypothetical protein
VAKAVQTPISPKKKKKKLKKLFLSRAKWAIFLVFHAIQPLKSLISSEFEVLKHSAAVGNAYKGGVARFQ